MLEGRGVAARNSLIAGETKPAYSQSVPAVAQAGRILFCLAQGSRPALSLAELAHQTGTAKSKAYSILNTLRDLGLVLKDEDSKCYSLGPAVLTLSRALLDRTDLTSAARPFLQELAAQTGGTGLLGLISGEHLFIMAREEAPGHNGLGVTIRVGHHYPLTWGAHGKVLVSLMPPLEREQLLSGSCLFSRGESRKLSADKHAELLAELEQIRAQEFALDIGGMQPGVNAAASPVLGHEGRVAGCLILVGTFSPAEAERVGEQVAAAAREMSLRLGSYLPRG